MGARIGLGGIWHETNTFAPGATTLDDFRRWQLHAGDELLATYRRLKPSGIEPFWTINHGPTISMYYRDPDANKVELQVDVFATIEAVNAFLDRYYPENFMGIVFDPEQMIRDYERGVPLEDLYRRPALPPGMTPWDMHRP